MNAFWDMLASASLQRLGWTLLHSVWQFALLAVLVSAVLGAMRRRSTEARYLTACIGLVAMMSASIATYWWLAASQIPESVVTTAVDEVKTRERIDVGDEAVPGGFVEESLSAPRELADHGPSSPFASDQALVGAGGTLSDAAKTAAATLSGYVTAGLAPWLPWVSLAWLGGVILVSARHLGAWVGVQRLRRAGTTRVDPDLRDRARQLMERMKIRRPVQILQSTLAELPIVVGWLHPVVLLPASLVTGMPPRQLEAILAHELAHVRRYDYLFNLLQTAAETLLFYHPAVWWLSRRIRIEREHCCDDVAVAVCGDNVEYAEALATVEQRRVAALAMAVGGHGCKGSTLRRVRRVLGVCDADNPSWRSAIGGSLAVLSLIFAILGYVAIAAEPEEKPAETEANGNLVLTEANDGRPAKGLQLGLSIEDKTTTIRQGWDGYAAFEDNCQPRELSLEFRNSGPDSVKVDTYLLTRCHLSFEVIGPETDSVGSKLHVIPWSLAAPRAEDFPTLRPGETWTTKVRFPSVFRNMAYGLLQPGDYHIRAVYENGPESFKIPGSEKSYVSSDYMNKTLGEAYQGRWQGQVKSNAVTLKVGPMVADLKAQPKPNLELTLVPERTKLVMKTGASNPEPIKLGLRFTNSTDKPLKLDTYLFARCHLDARIVGPDEDSVDYHRVDVSVELPQPTSEQFVTIQPGQSWATDIAFPGDFMGRSSALKKLGHYRLRMTYCNGGDALPLITATAHSLSYEEKQRLGEQYRELTDKLGDVCKGCWRGTAWSNEILLSVLPESGPRPWQDAAHYQALYARYKALIANAVRSGDKAHALKITEQFNDSIGGKLIYAGVGRSGSPPLISRFFGREGFPLPAISYDATDSGKVKVSLFDDYFLVETANPPGLDEAGVRLAFAALGGDVEATDGVTGESGPDVGAPAETPIDTGFAGGPRLAEPQVAFCRGVHAKYRGLIEEKIEAGDKPEILRLTDEFNEANDQLLAYAGVFRRGSNGKPETLLSKSYGRNPIRIPLVSYPTSVSGTVQASRFGDWVLIATANPSDGVSVRLVVAADALTPDRESPHTADDIGTEAVEGVTCRLRVLKTVWNVGEPLKLEAEIRNTGPKAWTRPSDPSTRYQVEVNGQRYHWVGQVQQGFPRVPLRQQPEKLPIEVDWAWRDDVGQWLKCLPGKYSVRVAVPVQPANATDAESTRVVSNPVQIEIVTEADPAPQTPWGPAAEGVQARLRADRSDWKDGETPTLLADVRNRGSRELHLWRHQALCKLEFDGHWYEWTRAEGSFKSSWFPPEREYFATPFQLPGNWQSKADKEPLALTAGKHTVRVALIARPPSGKARNALGPIRCVSNAVEVNIDDHSTQTIDQGTAKALAEDHVRRQQIDLSQHRLSTARLVPSSSWMKGQHWIVTWELKQPSDGGQIFVLVGMDKKVRVVGGL